MPDARAALVGFPRSLSRINRNGDIDSVGGSRSVSLFLIGAIMEPQIGYLKRDEGSGIELLINLFGNGWVSITLAQKEDRITMFIPYAQWETMVNDMDQRNRWGDLIK